MCIAVPMERQTRAPNRITSGMRIDGDGSASSTGIANSSVHADAARIVGNTSPRRTKYAPNAAELERLEALLLEGPEAHGFPTPLWSCPRVARLIEDQFGVRYHGGHVWKILRALHWSPQRPVGKARERNEEAIRVWKRKTSLPAESWQRSFLVPAFHHAWTDW
jgi:transposase